MKNNTLNGALATRPLSAWLLAACLCFALRFTSNAQPAIRPPSVPLVACDPYFSIWSPADTLNGADTVHWTGKAQRLTALARIDGKVYRVMGKEPEDVPALKQVALEITPTSTRYHFEGGGIELALAFITPAVPSDLSLYSSPFTYVVWGAKAHDGGTHNVQVYLDAAAEIAVNDPAQEVTWSMEKIAGVQKVGSKSPFKMDYAKRPKMVRELGAPSTALTTLKIGSKDQVVLGKKGDDLRIDWGFFYVAADDNAQTHQTVASANTCRAAFAASGSVTTSLDQRQPRPANDEMPVGATSIDLGSVTGKGVAPHWLILAYDDLYSLQYFKKNLRPYWRRKGADAIALLKGAAFHFGRILDACETFDGELMADLTKAGGPDYAQLCALAYRQCCAANKVVADENGQPLMFPKENFSNGCIGTVDVIYPMAPQFLFFSPSLTKAMLVPIMDYAASPRWRWPFAPHDLGTYPLANGQVYGGGERTEENQMPVEETGNMLVLLAALAQEEGNADFCKPYWPILEKWGDYLKAKGFDPEKQLCTDDFAGHLAHNVNLSAKAICGLGAYAKLCALSGRKAKSAEFSALAKQFAERWIKEGDDGDHFRLAFDRPDTWSQKYNLVWDRILGLNLFPDAVLRKEMDFYKTKLNTYGLPLDNRKAYTKLDWTLWTGTLTRNPGDFQTLLEPVMRFLNETPSRVPMTDWFDTKTGKQIGFQARSVVGGVFLRMLYDGEVWKQWAGKDRAKAAHWAPLPKAPMVSVLVPTSERKGLTWRYSFARPPGDWFLPAFSDSTWKQGPGGFGTKGTPGAVVRSEWNGDDIWLRRQFDLASTNWHDLQLRWHHDEDVEVYINGVLAAKARGFIGDYDEAPLSAAAKATLHPGDNLFAVHCHQTRGGQFVDVGLVDVKK